MSRRKPRRPATRVLVPGTSALVAYGPSAKNLYPHIYPSASCSWCGTEFLIRAGDVKVCPDCDLAPAAPTPASP